MCVCVCLFICVLVASRLVWCDRDNRGGAASRGPAGEPERAAPAPAPAQPAAPAPKKLAREELENKIRGTLEEFFSSRDKAELTQTVKVGWLTSLTVRIKAYYKS